MRFHAVERSGWYFELLPQNARRRTSLPEESSTHTATYGRFFERPALSGSVTVNWYPDGQLSDGACCCAWKAVSRKRKPEVRCNRPDTARKPSAPGVFWTSCRP